MKLYSKSVLLCFLLLSCYIFLNEPIHSATTLNLELVTNGLSSPLYLTAPPNDDRLFIVEQSGRIKIHQNGSILPTPYLDIRSQVRSGGELGLLGLAFHPDYATNGYFYVNYTTLIGNDTYTKICRFKVDSQNDNLADTLSEVLILQQWQPHDNHNGGMIAFGPDGYLYCGFGDGGSGGDPDNYGQNGGSILGSMLRIDVDGSFPYAIPSDNPFVNDTTVLDETWAIGLRNPWRFSFDRLNGDLYIGDVGQNIREEIDIQLSSSIGGENYGWRLKEGSACFNPSSNCEVGVTLTEPFFDYTHSGSGTFKCSITGGYVYRGSCLPSLNGMYFFADLCSRQIWSFRNVNGVMTDSTEYTSTFSLSQIASFGEDSNGELYIVDLSGSVYRIVPQGGSSQCSSSGCCNGIRGNIDGDGLEIIDISDLVYLVDFMFSNPAGPTPSCYEEGDLDSDLVIDISDLVYLVDFMFSNPQGPQPLDCV